MRDDIVTNIVYTNESVETTALRCCLAADDFSENANACDEMEEEFKEYEFDPDAPEGEQCIEKDMLRPDKIAPGLIARVVTVVFGTPEEQDRRFVSNDVCCAEIQEGCGGEDDGDDEFIDGSCNPGPNNPCETCDLTFYESQIFFANPLDPIGSLLRRIIGEDVITEINASQDRCCLAGV